MVSEDIEEQEGLHAGLKLRHKSSLSHIMYLQHFVILNVNEKIDETKLKGHPKPTYERRTFLKNLVISTLSILEMFWK